MPKRAVFAQLARVLGSPQFRSSKRCSLFLRHVVEQAVENRLDCLKERTLGIAVFDRDPLYDTNQDPIVRSTAGEVRKRLAQYYLDPAHVDELRFGVPTGSYMPEVRLPAERAKPVLLAVPLPPRVPRRRQWWIAAVACALVVVAASGFEKFNQSGLDRFWAPLLEGHGPLLVCLGQPRAYTPFAATGDTLVDGFENPGEAREPAPDFAAIPLPEVVPGWNWYTGVGNAQALGRISGLLALKGKRLLVRGGNSFSLTDLRGKPAVLLGASSNRWTPDLTAHLRFYFENDPKTGLGRVHDRQNPGKVDWKVVEPPGNRKLQSDFAIISRFRDATTEQMVLVVAGITQLGTQAAGEFLTTPEYFAEAVKRAPRGWNRENVQIVITAKVMENTVGPPQVMDVHVW